MVEIQSVKHFIQETEDEDFIIVCFYAPWDCFSQMLLSRLEKVSKKFDVKVIKINADKHEDLNIDFEVTSVPNIFFIKEGEIVKEIYGLQEEDTLKELIQKYTNQLAHV